jgi:RNA polymerase sigma-70 factor (ECF subfamily)
MTDSDDDLLAAVRAGDRSALERLLDRHQAAVYRFGVKMCREEEDARDVVQETLLAAVRHLPDFRGASSVSTWLYTIARSFCIKKRRTSKFAPQRIESLDAEPEAAARVADAARGPEEDASNRQLRGVLEEAIGSLDAMYREILVLRDVEGLSAPEVAEVVGISVEAVKSRLHRARVAVRERVAPHLSPAPAPDAGRGAGCRDAVARFSRRLEGDIEPGACAELEAHLARCPTCRGLCDSLRSTLSLCRSAGAESVPPRIAASVRDALHRFLESAA